MFPVIFELGPVRIFGYGLAIALGGVWAFRLLWLRRGVLALPDEESYWILVNGLLISGFGGAHLLYLVQYARDAASLSEAALNLSSGYSVFGSFILVTAFVVFYARWKKVSFLKLADTVFFCAALGHAFGRVGCFLAACCHGRPTALPWGVAFRDPRAMIPPELLGVPLHPVQLYEAAADAVLALIWWRVLRATDAGRLRPGAVVIGHLAAYGTMRFCLEFVRADTVKGLGPLTSGQELGLLLMAGAAALYAGREKCTRSC